MDLESQNNRGIVCRKHIFMNHTVCANAHNHFGPGHCRESVWALPGGTLHEGGRGRVSRSQMVVMSAFQEKRGDDDDDDAFEGAIPTLRIVAVGPEFNPDLVRLVVVSGLFSAFPPPICRCLVVRRHRRRLVCRVGGKGNKNSPNRTSTPATVNCVPDVPTSSNPSIRTRFVVCLSRFIQYCPGLSVWFLARPVGKWFFSEMN